MYAVSPLEPSLQVEYDREVLHNLDIFFCIFFFFTPTRQPLSPTITADHTAAHTTLQKYQTSTRYSPMVSGVHGTIRLCLK